MWWASIRQRPIVTCAAVASIGLTIWPTLTNATAPNLSVDVSLLISLLILILYHHSVGHIFCAQLKWFNYLGIPSAKVNTITILWYIAHLLLVVGTGVMTALLTHTTSLSATRTANYGPWVTGEILLWTLYALWCRRHARNPQDRQHAN